MVHLKTALNQFNNENIHSKSLYRVRCSDVPILNREDIFHIPFNKRHLVETQRYSIAGLPCLYLGASLYVCWQEMGKPDLNKLYLSHFKISANNSNDKVEFLDFAYSFETLQHRGLEAMLTTNQNESIEKQQSYLAMWPILLSCSFNQHIIKSKFNAEYVIPNLILQWIGKEKRPVAGIRYFSTRTLHLRHSDVGINYVFPPSGLELKNSGFCSRLSKTFVFSKPVSWQILGAIEGSKIENNEKFNLTDNFEEQLISKYTSTQFYAMEKKLTEIMECVGIENG
jgi:hypothetical protein